MHHLLPPLDLGAHHPGPERTRRRPPRARPQLTRAQDFFYACPGHLLDRGFATPVGPTVEELKADAAREVERVKREWERKEAEKKQKKKDKDGDKKDKDAKKDKDKDGADKDSAKKDAAEEEPAKEAPTVFTLHKYVAAVHVRVYGCSQSHRKIYDMRVMRIRQQQQAKRDRERLRNGTIFPSVPKNDPGSV